MENECVSHVEKEHPLVEQIKELLEKTRALEDENTELKIHVHKLATRERLYLSSLQKTKNDLLKLSQSIDTTPHVRSEEYQKFYEGGN